MRYYNRAGEPISYVQWRRLFEDKRYQVVRQTEVGEVMVSTVWLGMDHGWGEEHGPIIFETMIFGLEGDQDAEQYRYADEETALVDHEHLVQQLQLLRRAVE
jgi:hypothetical protein